MNLMGIFTLITKELTLLNIQKVLDLDNFTSKTVQLEEELISNRTEFQEKLAKLKVQNEQLTSRVNIFSLYFNLN